MEIKIDKSLRSRKGHKSMWPFAKLPWTVVFTTVHSTDVISHKLKK